MIGVAAIIEVLGGEQQQQHLARYHHKVSRITTTVQESKGEETKSRRFCNRTGVILCLLVKPSWIFSPIVAMIRSERGKEWPPV
tara:strand:+ start:199 stop:450 length:252 start_codon:yes stop_codon:yes gene_type:complete